jgi:carbon-monoxide dehydrogenase large subunit
MDAAARQTGIDPVELRRRNMVRPAQMPYKNAMGKTYDTGAFESVMNQGAALADWSGFDARAAESGRRGRLRGRGMATFVEWTGAEAFSETVTVTSGAKARSDLLHDAGDGAGLATTFGQLAVFGVPLENPHALGDTIAAPASAAPTAFAVRRRHRSTRRQRTVEKAQELAARTRGCGRGH